MEDPYLKKTSISIHGNEVEVVFNTRLTEEQFYQYEPFWQWCRNMDPSVKVKAINILAAKKFGSNVGFMFIDAYIEDKDGNKDSVAVYLRGPSAVILLILRDEMDNDYVVLTRQARLAVGRTDLLELIAGTMGGAQKIAQKAVKEIKEETGLEIDPGQLTNLATLIYEMDCPGIYVSPGGTDELFIPYVDIKRMPRSEIEKIDKTLAGLRSEGENIIVTIKPLHPLAELVRQLPDAKSLMTLMLYEQAENKVALE